MTMTDRGPDERYRNGYGALVSEAFHLDATVHLLRKRSWFIGFSYKEIDTDTYEPQVCSSWRLSDHPQLVNAADVVFEDTEGWGAVDIMRIDMGDQSGRWPIDAPSDVNGETLTFEAGKITFPIEFGGL